MKRLVMIGAAAMFATSAYAQMPTLTHEYVRPEISPPFKFKAARP